MSAGLDLVCSLVNSVVICGFCLMFGCLWLCLLLAGYY